MPRDDAAAPRVAEAGSPSLSLASAVMFVTELDRAVAFYADLLAWTVAVQDLDARTDSNCICEREGRERGAVSAMSECNTSSGPRQARANSTDANRY
jgi:predicted enzyme related to lactoylglutathione lyase